MQDRKLEQALDIYFTGEPDRETKEFQDAQKYLKLRIRLETCGWFSARELESFIRCAREKTKLRSLVWLLHLKDRKYGYQKKDFSL